jgi:hypothetical protein
MKNSVRYILLLVMLITLTNELEAQSVYTIKADSVKITNCDSSELIIENHTQNIPGFLFNMGNGRTIFKRGAQSLGNGAYLIGSDTLKLGTNAWLQGGNTFGTTGILGTLDSNHIDFYTSNTLQARLTNTGHLNLGSSTDGGTRLTVWGDAQVTGSFTQGYTQTANMGNGMILGFEGPISRILCGNEILYKSRSGGDQHLFANDIGSAFTGNLVTMYPGGSPDFNPHQLTLNVLATYGTTAFGVNVFGYTGIGTGTPNARLQVVGSSNTDTTSSFLVDNLTGTEAMRVLDDGTVRLASLTQDNSRTRVLVSDSAGNLFYRDASTLAANDLIRSSLAVNGPITANKLTLTVKDWPDYVFDTAFRLPALAGVEGYIRQQHHLPGLPSAGEVQKDGVDVGANQAALLKKIEELTLYTIAQDKNLEGLHEEIDALKKEIGLLKELIKDQTRNH